jgi:hypothetical protein
MRRRSFIAGLLGSAAVGAVQAHQTGKRSRIAIVNPAGTVPTNIASPGW